MSIAQGNRRRALLLAISSLAVLFALGAAKASAEVRWDLTSTALTHVAPGDGDLNTAELNYHLVVRNNGDSPAEGSADPGDPIVLSGTLPPGLTFVGPSGLFGPGPELNFDCSGTSVGSSTFSCQSTATMGSNGVESVVLGVSVDPGASGILTARLELSGAGGAATQSADPTRIAASQAGFGVDALDIALRAKGGAPYTQAGGHPHDFTTWVDFNTATPTEPHFGDIWPAAPPRDVFVDLPPGLVGNPSALGFCTYAQLQNGGFSPLPLCPASSQVGLNEVRFNWGGGFVKPSVLPVFNMVPPPGVAARFGFNVQGTVVVFDAKLRSDGDYGITTVFKQINQGLNLIGSTVTLWGVPGSSEHNSERACPGQTAPSTGGGTCPSGAAPAPFLRMPTDCGGALAFGFQTDSWFNPGALGSNDRPLPGDPRWASAEAHTHQPPGYPYSPADPTTPWGAPQGLSGCDLVPVKGRLAAQTTALDVESPSGLEVEVEVPNPGLENPSGIASSDIEGVKVAFPQGLTINPSQAEGLGVCSSAQYASTELSFHPDPSKGCPSDSKVGTVEVKSPLLNEILPGEIFVAAPHDNPFDSLLALYIVISEPERGIQVNLPGVVRLNETTGRIEAEFSDLPQIPFTTFKLKLREGARAPLVTPPACGTYETEAVFTPWSDPSHTVTSVSNFQVTRGIGGGPCPSGAPGFNPGFSAGSVNNDAGSFSEFVMRLTRNDGEQDMTKFNSILPPGVSAKIAGVGKCSDAAIASAAAKTGLAERANPSCPASSHIGRTLVGAGVGSVLTHVPGELYLAGPYKGSPLSVAAITPAVAGPFDVGVVVVRQALSLDPVTAEVHVDGEKSDPIPHILEGIPLKLRDLRIYVDRKSFTINPTSCDPSSVRATLFGSGLDVFNPADDVPVSLASRYQAANCAALGFKPKLKIKLRGGTKRGAHPGLRAVVTPRRGDANIDGATVTLPRSAFLEQAHIRTICTRLQFAANNCPKGAIYGKVKAWTPLLDEPLAGPVYLRSSSNKLPDLVFDLHGVVDIEVAGRIDSVNGGIRTTFASVPDAPISRVVLTMQGAKKGLIVNSANLCAARNRARATFTGQNGKPHSFRPLVKAQCGKKRKRGGKRK